VTIRTPTLALAALLFSACTGRVEGGGANGSPSPYPLGTAGSGPGGVAPKPATDPGRVTLHRLNRAEYDNTVKELLGTSQSPAQALPIDDRGSGFDNMADVLTLSPLHLSVFHAAASSLVEEAFSNATQRATLLSCDLSAGGESCAREVLRSFSYRAWRRPPTEAELNRLMTPVGVALAHGDTLEQGLRLALRAILLSPHFIFRVELDPDPTSSTPHPLGPYELASRLSYFLWSSMPDAALLESAATGALSEPATLRQQALRLLQDPKASALLENFAGQWLHLRAIDSLLPDAATFPQVDAALLSAMRAETSLMFRDIAFGGLPLMNLLTANYSYINDRLALHYGLPAVGSSEPVRVDLVGSAERGGLLSHAGFLTLTSHPERTSPVVRGKWVMDELLCAVVPPPPGDVDLSATAMAKDQGLTQRQALAVHRADPKCFSCHQLMDPIGLGLENYDAIGAYRTLDNNIAIDSAGQLPSGDAFSGAKELAAIIAANPDFPRCVAQKLYTYALGRPPQEVDGHLDAPSLDSITKAFVESGYSFSELAVRIVESPTFLNRRGEPGGAP
jgi:hypothetical protein